MLGYLDNDAETKRAYDGRWLKSGDLGKRDEENYFYITGRKKDIAIFCGVNISLLSLEQAVLDADLVEDISCVAEEDEDFGERVVAYAVAFKQMSDYEGTGAAILQAMLKHLPFRLACKEVRFVDALPRIGIGKIAKATLGLANVLHKVNLMQLWSDELGTTRPSR